MTLTRPLRVVLAALFALALLGVALWPVLSARASGTEVVLRVGPVDPIDPFRGAYVDLGYPDLPGFRGGDVPAPGEGERGPAYVPLTRQGEVWVGGPLQRTEPQSGLFLRCDDAQWRLRCGIESWFVPQDAAQELERRAANEELVAVVRVDAQGNAALMNVRGR